MIDREKIVGLACVVLLAGAFQGCAMTDESPQSASADASQAARVRDAINNDPSLSASQIDVESSANQVRLSGLVDTRVERQEAEAVAARVPGVSDVRNDIRVNNGD